jgi:hypothetical protein
VSATENINRGFCLGQLFEDSASLARSRVICCMLISLNREAKQFAEVVAGDTAWRQDRFVGLTPGAGRVIALDEYRYLAIAWRGQHRANERELYGGGSRRGCATPFCFTLSLCIQRGRNYQQPSDDLSRLVSG